MLALPERRSFALPNEEEATGLRLLLIALATVFLFHGGLLPFTHGRTYDAFIHMFFADSYHRSWFDQWEPRWYTGFATTSYPPGTHMAIAGLMHVMPLRAAFVVVQLGGLLVLTVGVFRFSLLWVAPRAAGFAAVALALSSSITETVHLFGQLPTIASLGIFLNGLPYVFRWIAGGGIANLTAAVIFASATTAAHHVTTLFGGILFIIPLSLLAFRVVYDLRPPQVWWHYGNRLVWPVLRGLLLGGLMIAAIVLTVLPHWIWSVSDPITQVPIPHGSRESFLERPDLGLVFFVLPWGTALVALPYAIYKTVTTRAWPLGVSVLFCFVLGTGGTTPIPRAILQSAFDILTLDRFTFWATILILPFVGLMLDGLLFGRSGRAIVDALGRGFYRVLVGGLFAATVIFAVMVATLSTLRPTQPDFIDPGPIVEFLAADEHDRWRYLTLGFGDQFAYLSALTPAQSVDGNYHSARKLPDLTSYSVERLENAKYLGVPGLGSLRQFLENAEEYHLKYIFSNDEFYAPLLHFTGWSRLSRLPNGVTVWEKPDISPLPLVLPRRDMPAAHMLIWGLVPPGMLVLAGLVFCGSALRRGISRPTPLERPVAEPRGGFGKPARVRAIVFALFALSAVSAGYIAHLVTRQLSEPTEPDAVIAAYFDHLDVRRFDAAYALLDPATRPPFDEVLFHWRWRGGLVASYGKLTDISISPSAPGATGPIRDWDVELSWLTALALVDELRDVRTIRRDGEWYIEPTLVRPVQTPQRLQRQSEVAWNLVGRRQPRADVDIHRDRLDRPRIHIDGARLVRKDNRYSLVGLVTNADADPAIVSLWGDLLGDDKLLDRQAVGDIIGQRLLPAQSSGFRLDFEGVLELDAAALGGTFDPTMFVPPRLVAEPETASVEARALVHGLGHYSGIALNNIRIEIGQNGPQITALAVNTGTETATIVRIVALLYDDAGAPVWTEAAYSESNIYPGQSIPVAFALPDRATIDVLADIPAATHLVNGSSQQADIAVPGARVGTIPMPEGSGYSAVRLNVSTMTYDPLL